ncbi:hypothetical protein DOTSEDRAFT_25971 [Dothistroma septosporum NZE10]|uniref:Uncharacterized protein n=1 Tax=Dothistroma septosporum (strain NZE10 / CBS 128990) TaxID=675120 RepID=N1PJR3_DOTSN|nr:hypothetical protein DOTSEDRAFT_25971 [Dothistroma septosporum NZE10]
MKPSLASGNSAPPGRAFSHYEPAPSVLLSFSRQPGAIVQSGAAVILHEPTRIITLQPGEAITKGSYIFVLNTGGLVAGTTTIPIAAVSNTPAPAVEITAGGDTYTIQNGPSGAVVAGNDIQATLVSGGATRLNGHTIAAGQNGHFVVDGSTDTLPQPTTVEDESPAISWTVASETYFAVSVSNGIIFAGPPTTASLSNGAVITLAGQPISAIGGGAVIVNSTKLSMGGGSAAALAVGSGLAVHLAGTTLTIVDGSQTVLDGISYDVPSKGGGVIVHGNGITSTVLASARATLSIPNVVKAPPTTSTSPEGSRPPASSSGGTMSTAHNVWIHGVMVALLIAIGHINL